MAASALLTVGFPTAAVGADPPADRQNYQLPLPARAAAEATAAVDPQHPGHLAVAMDPYRRPQPVRIEIVVSLDGGRTWTAPIVVLPPGTAKSYDPVLSFSRSGALLIGGGASQSGAEYCQPGSRVFLATLPLPAAAADAAPIGVPSYVTTPAQPPGTFVDRPALAYDPSADRAYLSWTASTGSAAECRAVPLRSRTMLAEAGATGIGEPRSFPDPLAAPYGSALAVPAPGALFVVAGERGTDGRQQIVAATTPDGGQSWLGLQVVDIGQVAPLNVPGFSTLSLATPTVAVSGQGRVALAWTQAGPQGQSQARLAVREPPGRAPDGWRLVAAPDAAGAVSVLTPAVAFHEEDLLLETATLSGSRLGFRVSQGGAGRSWRPVIDLGVGDAGAYEELGEALGLAADGSGVVLAAAPLAGSTSSSLQIATLLDPPPTSSPSAAPAAGSGRTSGSGSDLRWITALAVALTALGLLRRRAQQRELRRLSRRQPERRAR